MASPFYVGGTSVSTLAAEREAFVDVLVERRGRRAWTKHLDKVAAN